MVSEGTFDKAMMAMMIANTAASMGMEVHIFHTFFGLNLMKKTANPKLPGMYQLFTGMFIKKMKEVGVEDYPARRRWRWSSASTCTPAAPPWALMNIKQEDMGEGVMVLGAAGFLNIAADADCSISSDEVIRCNPSCS